MPERRLAYKNSPGVVHAESAWVKSRTALYGENVAQAEAEIKQLIASGIVIVIKEKADAV